jgi:hypothetical protein
VPDSGLRHIAFALHSLALARRDVDDMYMSVDRFSGVDLAAVSA